MNRIDVLGVSFDNLTLTEAVENATQLVLARRAAYIVTPNPEIVMEAWKNPEFADTLAKAGLVLPDGIGIIKAARTLGTPLRERVPGIDMASGVLEWLAREGRSAFLFGAKPGVAEKAAQVMTERYPGLKIVGCADGYFDDDAEIIEKINSAAPDFLLVCLGAPKQELWMHKNASRLNIGAMAGLGGSLDVFAGVAERAPAGWQRLGLEWLYRCFKEPKRFKRIVRLPLFMLKAMGVRIKRIFNGKEG